MIEFNKLESEVNACENCRLGAMATNRVFGEGDTQADIMIVGETPGREDNSAGRPFVGDVGQLLDRAFDKLSLRRMDFYITNILKCWAPSNRITTDIKQECIPACYSYLKRQIGLVQPKVIITLGSVSMQTLVNIHSSIGKMRGKVMAGPHETLVVPTWHPSYLLRTGKASKSKQRKLAKEFIADFECALTIAEVSWEKKK